MIDFTPVIGVDAKTLPQLHLTAPTWARYRPEMFRQPWLVFYDAAQVTLTEVRDTLVAAGKTRDVRAFQWPTIERVAYANQREKMLSGFCHVCRFVETPWWLKVDTDAVALRESDWAPDEWFRQQVDTTLPPAAMNYQDGYNVIIASPWGYTKPADQMDQLDQWGDLVPGLREYPRLDIPFTPGGRRARHARIASWVSFYRTDWSRFASDLALHYAGRDRLPVPSQDGYHFFVAKRRGDRILRAQMKRRGWTNCPRLEQLKTTVAKALRGEFA